MLDIATRVNISTAMITGGDGTSIIVFVGAILALIVTVVMFARRQKARIKENGVSVLGHVVASRIRQRVNGIQQPYGYGIDSGITVGIGGDDYMGSDFMDRDFDVMLSIEFVDPHTNLRTRTQERASINEARSHLPSESFTIESTSIDGMIDFSQMNDFQSVKYFTDEARHLRESGMTTAEAAARIDALKNADLTGFTQLVKPVPVTVWVDDTCSKGRRIIFEWVK